MCCLPLLDFADFTHMQQISTYFLMYEIGFIIICLGIMSENPTTKQKQFKTSPVLPPNQRETIRRKLHIQKTLYHSTLTAT